MMGKEVVFGGGSVKVREDERTRRADRGRGNCYRRVRNILVEILTAATVIVMLK